MTLISPTLKRYALPKEFDGAGKYITILNFELLTVAELTARDGRAPKYPPKNDPYVRRLTFTEGMDGTERIMDVNSPRFQDDLAKYDIKTGTSGILKRTPRQGINKGFSWEFIISQ